MFLADTFLTNGGDTAVSGPLVGLVGLVGMVVALLIGLTPRRPDSASACGAADQG